MTLFRCLAVVLGLSFAAGLRMQAHQKPQPPSIDFGMAQVSIGMTQAQVEKSLADKSRHLQFLSDKHTALVLIDGTSLPNHEGQVTFVDGRVAYAVLQLPVAHDANELAQEIAGAVETMNTKACSVRNYSGHGTGGGYTETIFDCGSQKFGVFTEEPLGSERATNVEITIGEMSTN